MVYMLISNVSTWTLKLSFFNRFFIFVSLFLLVYFVYSLFLIKIVLFRLKKLSFIIKILNLVGRSNIWVRCCLNQGYSRILVKSLSKRGSPEHNTWTLFTSHSFSRDFKQTGSSFIKFGIRVRVRLSAHSLCWRHRQPVKQQDRCINFGSVKLIRLEIRYRVWHWRYISSLHTSKSSAHNYLVLIRVINVALHLFL